MGDYGAAVSQKGYDVKTCDDRFLVYSSAFQTLKIFNVYSVSVTLPADSGEFTASASTDYFTHTNHKLQNGDMIEFNDWGDGLPSPIVEGVIYYVVSRTDNTFKVSLTLGGSAVNLTADFSGDSEYYPLDKAITISHNLGYYAPFFVIYNGGTTTGVEESHLNSVDYSYINAKNYQNELVIGSIDNNFNGNVAGDTIYFTVYVFLDDFSTIEEKIINNGISSGSSSTDYGIRISKEGYDVKTCDDKDCILSSSFFSQIIHKKGIEITNSRITGDFTANASTNILTSTAHGLSNGDRIWVDSTDTLPAPLDWNLYYYVINKTTNTFQLSLTSGGSAIDITNTGSGTHDFGRVARPITHNLGYYPAYLLYELVQDDEDVDCLEMVDVGINSEIIDIIGTADTYYYIIFKQKNG